MSSQALEWFEENSSKYPEYSEVFTEAVEYLNHNLWHQYTDCMVKSIYFSHSTSSLPLRDFFNNTLLPLSDSVDLLSLVMCATVTTNTNTNSKESEKFLKSLLDVVKSNREAVIYLHASIAATLIAQHRYHPASEELQISQTTISASNLITRNAVLAYVHKIKASLAKETNNTAEYYNQAMLYLTYVDANSLTDSEKNETMCQVIEASIIAETYTLGRCLTHPMIQYVDSNSALFKLLTAFNYSQIDEYNSIMDNLSTSLPPSVVKHRKFLDQKIRIMALVTLVHSKSISQRTISIEDVAKYVHTDATNVHIILMKAISSGVVKATINAVTGFVSFHRAIPRVLDKNQIIELSDRVHESVQQLNDTCRFAHQTYRTEMANV